MENDNSKNNVDLQDIQLTEGDNKYIFVIDKDGNHHTISKHLKWHKDIYDTIADVIPERNVLGGGWLKHNSEKKVIEIYGSSGSYGKANHEAVKEFLQTRMGRNYTIKSELDIKEEKKKEQLELIKQIGIECGSDIQEMVNKLPVEQRVIFYETTNLPNIADKEDVKTLIEDKMLKYLNNSGYVNKALRYLETFDLLDDGISKKVMQSISKSGKDYSLEDVVATLQKSSQISEDDLKNFIDSRLEQMTLNISYQDARNHFQTFKKVLEHAQNYGTKDDKIKGFAGNFLYSGIEKTVSHIILGDYQDVSSTLDELSKVCEILKEKTPEGKKYGKLEADLSRFLGGPDPSATSIAQKGINKIFHDYRCDKERVQYANKIGEMFNVEKQVVRDSALKSIKSKLEKLHYQYKITPEMIKELAKESEIDFEEYKAEAVEKVESLFNSMVKESKDQSYLNSTGRLKEMLDNFPIDEEVYEIFDKTAKENLEKNGKYYSLKFLNMVIRDEDISIPENHIIERVKDLIGDIDGTESPDFYINIMSLNCNLKNKGIELDTVQLISEERKEEIYEQLMHKERSWSYDNSADFTEYLNAKDAYAFANVFAMDKENRYSAAKIIFTHKAKKRPYEAVDFIESTGLDKEKFYDCALQSFSNYVRAIEAGEKLKEDYYGLSQFGYKMGLPEEMVIKAGDEAINYYLGKSNIDLAYGVAKRIEHPKKEALSKVHIVLGGNGHCI
ncbi:MAG: hypothetical protein U9R34_05265 [Nanoarchaeota archaeon]|nr:hypothetical protein [Nanoarchaeota archaeon]